MSVTVATAARIARVSAATIRTWCRRGTVAAVKVDGRWMVSVRSLAAHAPLHMPTDRPRAGEMRPAKTGRAGRRAAQRATARAEARTSGTRVIGHQQRAIIGNANVGRTLAVDYLRALGFRGEAPANATGAEVEAEVRRFASAFGRAVAKTYREAHGRDPFGSCKAFVNGAIRNVFGYDNLGDLEAGAFEYRRTRAYLIPRQATTPAAPTRKFVNA